MIPVPAPRALLAVAAVLAVLIGGLRRPPGHGGGPDRGSTRPRGRHRPPERRPRHPADRDGPEPALGGGVDRVLPRAHPDGRPGDPLGARRGPDGGRPGGGQRRAAGQRPHGAARGHPGAGEGQHQRRPLAADDGGLARAGRLPAARGRGRPAPARRRRGDPRDGDALGVGERPIPPVGQRLGALGATTANPYDPTRTACGSSSGGLQARVPPPSPPAVLSVRPTGTP